MDTKVLDIESLMREVGAWHSGHFLLSSGLHSDQYMQCQRLLQYPRRGLMVAEMLAEKVLAAGLTPRTVVGPALGAIHWELLVALALDKKLPPGAPVRGIFAERPQGNFEIRRGIEIAAGEPVLVVEDVTTTGGSARKVVELVQRLGGNPVAVGAIVDRSGGSVSFDVPFITLLTLSLNNYAPHVCAMCAAGQPLTKPGTTTHKA
jgi:orotate phosphoribosyltransferase